MRFRVLGPMEVFDGTDWRGVGPAKWRGLLATLLINGNHVVSVDQIADELWGDQPPKTVVNQVHGYVARVRALLGDRDGRVLGTTRPGYRLNLEPGDVDAERFSTLAQRGDAELPGALALWRGPAYADVPDTALVRAEATRLEERRLAAREAWADAELTAGRHTALVPELTTLLDEQPLRERLWEQLILALARSGRQADALAAYRRVHRLLDDELGVAPNTALQDLQRRILHGAPEVTPPSVTPDPPAERPGAWRGPRSPVRTLIGREDERRTLATLLDEHRLVTVTGAGGCGKTTLALSVAADLAPHFEHGVSVLPLSSVATVEHGIGAMAELFDVNGVPFCDLVDAIERKLGDQRMLLVLDNCEHLAPDCGRLCERLLAACPKLTVLATSRQPIGVCEEAVWPLGPLEIPGEGARSAAATELFLTRARAAMPALSFGDEELADIATICRRLDGLPLAIELAAARVRALSPAQIAARLDEGFELLAHSTPHTEARHQTLTATITWSYHLLTDVERTLLNRLSVFVGDFGLADVEAVCGAGMPDVAATFAGLVDRSLVAPCGTGDGRRFSLLQTVRGFAAARLAEAGEAQAVADRHLDHWLGRARELDALAVYPRRVALAKELGPDLANIRAALEHAYLSGRVGEAAELTARMFELWLVHPAHLSDGELRLERALGVRTAASPEVAALLRFHQTIVRGMHSDPIDLDDTARLLDELAPVRPREHLEARAFLLTNKRFRLDASVLDDITRTLEVVTDPGIIERYPSDVRTVLTAAGWVLAHWGRHPEAAELCARYDVIDPGTRPSHAQLGLRVNVAIQRGDVERARQLAAVMRDRLPAIPHPAEQETTRCAIAVAYLATGQPDEAGQFLAESIGWLRGTYPRLTRQLTALHLLHAEALRRCGDPAAALGALATGLRRREHQTYASLALPGVLVAALLAAELGDTTAMRELGGRWNELRRRVGQPVPAGFTDAAATVLGVHPGAPRRPAPDLANVAETVHALVADTHSWCTRHTGRALAAVS